MLKDNPIDSTKRMVNVLSKDSNITIGTGNLGASDPKANGGSLRVASTAGGFDHTYPLPANNWSYIGGAGDNKGYKYKDPAGPIRAALLKPGKLLKAKGKGSALTHSLGTNPNPVDMVLTTGCKTYCMRFGGEVSFIQGKKYLAKDSSEPTACP